MKSFLFLVGVIAFYLGVNYISFTEGAVERWIQKTQFPSTENTEIFCNMLTPETNIEFSFTVNNRKTKYVTPSTNELCTYFKGKIIPGAKRNTVWIKPKIISHQRNNSIPYNKAKSTIEMTIRSKTYTITRKLDIELMRGLLGDFTILSIKGHDQITQEEKPKHHY